MTFWGIFSTQGETYYFHMEGSMQDEIEPKRGENWTLKWTLKWTSQEGGSMGQVEGGWGVGATVGGWGAGVGCSFLIPYCPYLVSHLPHLVCHPSIWYSFSLPGIHSACLVPLLPYLISHVLILYPIPDRGYPYINESPKWNSSLLDIFTCNIYKTHYAYLLSWHITL